MCLCVHSCKCEYRRLSLCVHVCLCMHACKYMCTYMCMPAGACIVLCNFMSMFLSPCMYVHVHISISVHVSIYMHVACMYNSVCVSVCATLVLAGAMGSALATLCEPKSCFSLIAPDRQIRGGSCCISIIADRVRCLHLTSPAHGKAGIQSAQDLEKGAGHAGSTISQWTTRNAQDACKERQRGLGDKSTNMEL